jgi:hypothetical protein
MQKKLIFGMFNGPKKGGHEINRMNYDASGLYQIHEYPLF